MPAGTQLRKCLIVCHRWLGVCFSLLFAMWFASGIAMMYWDYPGVGPEDRLAHAAPLDAARIHTCPADAYASLHLEGPPDEAQLVMFDGRPTYRFRSGRDRYTVFADDGKPLDEVPEALARRVAATWAGQPQSEARFEGSLTVEDQWTVSGAFRPLRPLFKYSWPTGDEVYVSGVTGEVAQHTTRASRLGAYFGAIPHWLYFTPLRKNGQLWSRVVIWSSGGAAVAALLGIIVGIWMYSPSRDPSIPYTGQKRLHMILGLSFGIIACTWAFSGMLSMDPFPAAAGRSPGAGSRINSALRGTKQTMAAYAAMPPRQVLAQMTELQVKELDLTSFAGEPAYVATESPHRSRVISVRGAPAEEFDSNRILEVVQHAVQPATVEIRLINEYDAYYLGRHHERPLPVLLVRLNDTERSRYYIDPRTARVVGSYSDSSWMTRWLYHGLHSIDLPWLYKHRPAWDVLVLVLLIGGTALSVTSVVIAWRKVRRKLLHLI